MYNTTAGGGGLFNRRSVYRVLYTLLRTVLQRATKITTAALECTGHLEFIQVPLWRSLNTALRWTALHIYDQIATPLF